MSIKTVRKDREEILEKNQKRNKTSKIFVMKANLTNSSIEIKCLTKRRRRRRYRERKWGEKLRIYD